MADERPFFQLNIHDRRYVIDRLTLGDFRLLKREFGQESMQEFSADDADAIVGLLTIAVMRQDEKPLMEALAYVESLNEDDIAIIKPEPEAEEASAEDPTPAVASAAIEAPSPEPAPSVPATNPPEPGAPS